ncbi:MAG: hypothetical protein FD123_807 [Bacteroidetes bacterium]|nr:MAG: hypothetical protein FD123_807 [Bacteroidota bacterium]
MAENHDTGTWGEETAMAFLREKGLRILHCNWRFLHLELDIVAMDGEKLVIVEVKTRGSIDFGDPQSFVSRAKQKKLIRAANHYIQQNDFNGETRFDVVAIVKKNTKTDILHIADAFRPVELS